MHLKFKVKNQPSTRDYGLNTANSVFQLVYNKDNA